jgi:uncharacterized protein
MRGLFSLSILAISVGAHWVVYRWTIALFAFKWPKTKLLRLRNVALALGFLLPIARALTLHSSHGAVRTFAAFTVLEIAYVSFCAIPVLLVWLARATGQQLRRAWQATRTLPTEANGASQDAAEEIAHTPGNESTQNRLNYEQDVDHLATDIIAQYKDQEKRPSALPRRDLLTGTVGALGYGLIGAGSLWGYRKGRFEFQVEELIVKMPGMSRALDGYTIAQISDIHVGPFMQESELEIGLSVVRSIKPDLLVLTGDLVDAEASYAEVLARAIQRIPTRDGRFGILGNHDHYAGAESVYDTLNGKALQMLVNSSRVMQGARGFALLGVDDMAGRSFGGIGPRYDEAAAHLAPDIPKILLAHQPAYADRWYADLGSNAQRPVLQLSGHTHGGQINLPGIQPVRWVHPFVKGRYEVLGTTLYVNRGFGVAGPPVRLMAPPEVTKIILISA